jgi:hypothetical protein
MKLFTQGRYATVASTAALVVALGGTSYAAALVTSGDIQDGTVQTKDLNPTARIATKVVHNDNGTVMDGSNKTVLSTNVKAGSYVVSAKVQAFPNTTSPYVNCWLTGPGGTTLDTGYWWLSGQYGYGEVTNQASFTTAGATTVQLNCTGSNASVYYKKLSITRVASVADLTGANVSFTATPHKIAPTR